MNQVSVAQLEMNSENVKYRIIGPVFVWSCILYRCVDELDKRDKRKLLHTYTLCYSIKHGKCVELLFERNWKKIVRFLEKINSFLWYVYFTLLSPSLSCSSRQRTIGHTVFFQTTLLSTNNIYREIEIVTHITENKSVLSYLLHSIDFC